MSDVVNAPTVVSAATLGEIREVFEEGGPLSRGLKGYRPRAQQIELAEAISRAIQERGTLVAEAGTGTGKTFAYLVPVLMYGGKVLVSTGTKTLQDQLFARDLPAVRGALGLPVTTALLKGRSNYLCHYHLERTLGDGRLGSRAEVAQLRKIELFARQTRSGDKAELADVPENAEIWHRVTSTRDNCLGSECPSFRECFVMQARKRALDADVVVVNHALFLADLALKDEGITDLLPAADTVVFDEAHQLPAAATRFLGESVSSHQLLDFARDATVAGLSHARESADWVALGQAVEQAARELRLSCAAVEKMPGQRSTFDMLPSRQDFGAAVQGVIDAVHTLGRILAAVGERHPDLDLAAKRGPALIACLARWTEAHAAPATQEQAGLDQESAWPEPPAPKDDGWVRWVETGASHIRLHTAPLSVAQAFSQYRPAGQAWILTSATLSVREDFSHFTRQLGLYEATTGRWESPFDYAVNGRLFVPHGIPAPQDPRFTEGFVEVLLPLLEASQGSALVLCTTLRAVDRVAELLDAAFRERGWDWPLFKQGDRSRRELLERFRASRHGVLVGSASFWEGIDVPGDALTLVAIDKLPFAPPDDPVLDARIRACKERGGNPFFEYQLPEAAIALKQGAGRLIRTETDWGVLMVADRRLVEKPYGKLLWRGLPPFTRTRNVEDVEAFYAERAGAQQAA
ncbi:putative ATP-dependent helicase DinG [Pigmentiphaga humi]|uniref:DNA 5'-3' helicase n=1 Tax=Pigmentiphaga humi TaxID=2478468 RepID=A0A3P4B323_9BURK|nr:ATP-dependent DNA helicase [Pigmentiphaga humi]VCU70301.1 putative ATP-dependent helicase DinG [Pigmentiphaga humi]